MLQRLKSSGKSRSRIVFVLMDNKVKLECQVGHVRCRETG